MRARQRSTYSVVGMIGLGAVFAACGDGSGRPPNSDAALVGIDGTVSPDASVAAEAGAAADGAPRPDATAADDALRRTDAASTVDGSVGDSGHVDGGPPPLDAGGGDSVGGTSCADIYQCLAGCAPGDASCANACVAAGSSAGQQLFNAANNCMVGASAGTCATSCATPASPQCDACLQSACGAQLAACFGASRPPLPADGGVADGGGSLGCQGIFNCLAGCPNGSPACSNACVAKGSAAGQAQFSALSWCVQGALSNACAATCATPGTQCDNCLLTACSAEVNACQP